jgi:hypothetical protein
MKKLIYSVVIIIVLTFIISGCLTVEKKEYKIQLTGKTSGNGTIKYINIVSQKEDNKDVSMKDFAELITDYIQGDKITNDFPGIKVINKKVFEENGVLCAEFSFEFDSLSHVKVFQYDKDSPFMLVLKESYSSEEYDSSNGEYNLNNLPIIFWKKGTKDFEWKTKLSDSSNTVSLLEQYKSWEKNKK